MAKTGEGIIVHPTDIFTMIPVRQCSSCTGLVNGYYPDKICLHCGSNNKENISSYIELTIFGEV